MARSFFDRLWHDPNRRFGLFSRWLMQRPSRAPDGVAALQEIVETLLLQPGDVSMLCISEQKGSVTGKRISLMANDAFSLQWTWFKPAERRFFLWLGSMHKMVFLRKTPQDKGIRLDQFVHSDVVWSKHARRLLLRDLILFCRWQEPKLHQLSHFLLVAVQRIQHKKDRPLDRDDWFLTQMSDILQGQRGPPHEMQIESPRKPSGYVPTLTRFRVAG